MLAVVASTAMRKAVLKALHVLAQSRPSLGESASTSSVFSYPTNSKSLDHQRHGYSEMTLRPLLTAALAATTAFCKPTILKSRAVIAHDAVVGFAEAVPDNSEGDLMLAYKPYLKVFNGCVPFPAVDADGNTS